jgi:hypothetical protein
MRSRCRLAWSERREKGRKKKMLTDEQKEPLREAGVALLLQIRRQYLSSGQSALTWRDQMETRIQMAARQTTEVEAWSTKLLRSLRLVSPDRGTSSAMLLLRETLRPLGESAGREWMRIIIEEHGYLIARVQLAAEQAKKTKSTTEDVFLEPGAIPIEIPEEIL